MKKEELLNRLTAAYTGPGSTDEGSFAGDVLRACADAMAELWSMEIDGLERRAFVSSATGDWLTKVCADRGVDRKEGEADEELRQRTLTRLASQPASGNADHYAAWCARVEEILRVRVLPLARGNGTVDIVAVGMDGRAPENSVLNAAQAVVDLERPVGVDAKVIAAAEEAVDISAGVKLLAGSVLSVVQADFAAALQNFCRSNALLTDTVSYAKLLQLLLEIPGVADVSGFRLNGGEESHVLANAAVAVVGAITLTEV